MGGSTWVYRLRQLDDERTRLIVRWRARFKPSLKTPMLVLMRLLLAPIEFVMEKGMLLGIKQRAERTGKQLHAPGFGREETVVQSHHSGKEDPAPKALARSVIL